MEQQRLNWSTLRYLAVSPRLLRWRVDHPRPDSSALVLGRAIHCAILEPEAFSARWVAATNCAAITKSNEGCRSLGSLYADGQWYCRVRGHAPAGAGDAPAGVEVIGSDQVDIVHACAESVRAHAPAAKLLSGGHPEQEMEWADAETRIECRGRVDYLRPTNLLDVKSTRRETPREFIADAARNLYHAQLAWYHDGAVRAGRLPAEADLPYIVSVSTAEPYDVTAYHLSPISYQAGQIAYHDLLNRYAQCRAANWWPGHSPDLEILELPTWATGMNGSESSEDSW